MKVIIYTVSGEKAREMTQAGKIGYNYINWDCQNSSGKPVASGVFIYSIEAVSGIEKQKLWGKAAVVK